MSGTSTGIGLDGDLRADGTIALDTYPPLHLPLTPRQQVTLVLQLPDHEPPWPDDVADIYREIADEDCRLAALAFSTVRETWRARAD